MEKSMYLNGEYVEKNPLYHVGDSPWKAQQILKLLNKHGLQPASICEVGCGAGEILRQLQFALPRETKFYGYEISPQAFALCKQRENEKLRFFCEDFLAKQTEVFDLLLCLDVFEHVEDYMGFLRKLRQRAKYKFFHIPLDLSVQSVLRCTPLVQGRAQAGHLHYFMQETALLTLQETGYEIVDFLLTPGSIDLAKTLKTKLANLPRKLISLLSPALAARLFGGYSLLVVAK